jgi:twitching motility two-component system response regulator PilH
MGMERRVLVVDDSAEVREFLKAALELAGYRVETAENGEEAFAKVVRQRPDLIVLDVMMPVMDGLQLLLKLRSDLAPPLPPAILCSGFDMTAEEALRRGAVRFLPKPIDARDLVAAVGDLLAGRPSDEATTVRAVARAGAARKEAREIAARLMRDLEAQQPQGQPFAQHAAHLVTFVARYLDVDAVVAAVLRQDRLLVLASSEPSKIAPELDLGDVLPMLSQVVESGSSLVLPNVASHPSFSWLDGRIDGVRCLIAVPLRFEDRAIGVLCMLHSCECEISGEDLALMQLFSSRGTALLHAWAAGRLQDELPFRLGPGVAARRAFERLLDLELRMLHGRGGSLELVIASASDLREVYRAVAGAASPARLLGGLLADGRVAFYKRDLGGGARVQLAAVLAELRAHGGASSVGAVDLKAGVFASLHAEDLVRLAEQALDDALETETPMLRMVVDGESA